jgi:hypothetical protein
LNRNAFDSASVLLSLCHFVARMNKQEESNGHILPASATEIRDGPNSRGKKSVSSQLYLSKERKREGERKGGKRRGREGKKRRKRNLAQRVW